MIEDNQQLEPEIAARLEMLLDALRLDSLCDDQAAELESLLKQYPAARREYILTMAMTGEIRRLSEIQRSTQASLAEAVLGEKRDPSSSSRIQPSSQLGFLSKATRLLNRYLNQPAVLSVITAVFIMTCIVIALALVYLPGENGRDQLAKLPETGVENEVVAHLSRVIDARWNNAKQTLTEESPLYTNQLYHLTEGKIQITFFGGVETILIAPVKFELSSKAQIKLYQGRLTGKVPENIKSFVVQTSVAKIIDLGTEFGVQVKKDQTTSVKVYVGSVQVDSNLQDDSKILEAGDGLLIRPTGALASLPKLNINFQRSLPTQSEERGERYSKYVQSLKPLAHWQFEEGPIANMTNDSSKNRHTAELVSMDPATAYKAGRFGKYAMRFDGRSKNRLNLSDLKTLPDEFVISAWIKPRSAGYDNRGMLMLYETPRETFVLAVASDHDGKRRQREFTCYSGRGTMSSGRNSVHFHKWNHVIFAAKKDSSGQRWYQLYLNGKLMQRILANKKKDINKAIPNNAKKILIGCRDMKNNSYNGLVDEFVMFDHTLSENELLQLYELGK